MELNNYSQVKKDDDFLCGNHLGTRSKVGEGNLAESMPMNVDNQLDFKLKEELF